MDALHKRSRKEKDSSAASYTVVTSAEYSQNDHLISRTAGPSLEASL